MNSLFAQAFPSMMGGQASPYPQQPNPYQQASPYFQPVSGGAPPMPLPDDLAAKIQRLFQLQQMRVHAAPGTPYSRMSTLPIPLK